MRHVFVATVLTALFCTRCTTVDKALTDARLLEAQQAFFEGQRLLETGQYTEAEQLAKRALKLLEATSGKTHPGVAQCLSLLGIAHYQQGDYAQAELLHTRALIIRATTFGQHHPEVASSLNNLAVVYRRQGNYTQAASLYERALTIREATLGKNQPPISPSLFTNVNSLYSEQGDYAGGEPSYKRGFLPWPMRARSTPHPDAALFLNNLANLYQIQRSHSRAEPLYKRALAILEASLGEDHPNTALSLHNLASLYSDQGNYAQAEPLHKRAFAIRERALGMHHPDVAASSYGLAHLYSVKGDYARAEPLYERALAIWEATFGKNHPDVASSLNSLAQVRLAQQRFSEALPLFERSFYASEAHLRQEAFGYSGSRLDHFLLLMRAQEERFYALVRAYPDDARVRRLALSAALLRKGRSVEEISNTSRIVYRSLGQTDRKLLEYLRTLRTRFATLSLEGPGMQSHSDYKRRLKSLADEGDALETVLARRSAPLRALYKLPFPAELVDRVAEAIPSDGALIEFIAYNNRPLTPKPGTPLSKTQGELRYLAVILFADGRIHAFDLGPAAAIDHAVLRLHQALKKDVLTFQTASQELYKLAFHPLVPLLGNVRRLFLSPDGQLALVPFDALYDGHRTLLDAWNITYLTSGKELLRRPEDVPPASSVVVLADPDFGAPLAVASPSTAGSFALVQRSIFLEGFFSTRLASQADRPLPSLPGTRKEAELIKRLFPHAALLLGRDATKAALLRLNAPGVLHIATHGFFLDDAPPVAASRAAFYFGAVGDTGPHQSPPDPMLRSGLVLAGALPPAAQPGARRREDSLVTALELGGLNLWGTQLVVLSACDTGRGDVKLGQGVYGLRRALVVAGTETLVTSLWKIDDETTRQLMEAYYANLLAGQGRAEALREAMRAVRRELPHPRFWAPFIAIGRDAPLQGLTQTSPHR